MFALCFCTWERLTFFPKNRQTWRQLINTSLHTQKQLSGNIIHVDNKDYTGRVQRHQTKRHRCHGRGRTLATPLSTSPLVQSAPSNFRAILHLKDRAHRNSAYGAKSHMFEAHWLNCTNANCSQTSTSIIVTSIHMVTNYIIFNQCMEIDVRSLSSLLFKLPFSNTPNRHKAFLLKHRKIREKVTFFSTQKRSHTDRPLFSHTL